MVDGAWDAEESEYPDYKGWMKANVSVLTWMYHSLHWGELYLNWSVLEERADDGTYLYTG